MPRPSRPEPQRVGRVLEELVTRRRWAGRLDGARIFELWPDVAGPEVAANATPVRLHGGVLVLAATDAGWATQLRYLAPELQARANTVMGPDTVRQVEIVVRSADRD